jgi:hypothetical protein
MTEQIKTDNKNLDAKILLRRRVLDEAKFAEHRVLDLCAGEGSVWRAMRQHAKLDDYVPVDLEPRLPGTIVGNVKDERFLSAFDLSRFNIIDIDTYGEPWKPWAFLQEHLTAATAIFLTHGAVSTPGGAKVSNFVLERLGIPPTWAIPMKRDLSEFAAPYMLHPGKSARTRIAKGWKVSLHNVTYYGLICEPRKEKTPHG